jgi:hypothetical protein
MRRIHVGWRPLGDHVSAQRRGDFWAPTSARGLSGLPRAGQVLESSLIDALERQNHAHPYHDASRFSDGRQIGIPTGRHHPDGPRAAVPGASRCRADRPVVRAAHPRTVSGEGQWWREERTPHDQRTAVRSRELGDVSEHCPRRGNHREPALPRVGGPREGAGPAVHSPVRQHHRRSHCSLVISNRKPPRSAPSTPCMSSGVGSD